MDRTESYLNWLGSPDGESYANICYQRWWFYHQDMMENDGLPDSYALDELRENIGNDFNGWWMEVEHSLPMAMPYLIEKPEVDLDQVAKAMIEVFEEWYAEDSEGVE